jgi:starch synthase
MLKIAFVASEFAPLAKTGGLADVTAGLSRFLRDIGQDVRVFLPFYSRIDTAPLRLAPVDFVRDVPISLGPHAYRFTLVAATTADGRELYLVQCPELYRREGIYTEGADEHRRFALLTRAAIESCQRMAWAPSVFHVHDWHTSLLPIYLRTIYAWDKLFERSKTMLTIHNVGYQGLFSTAVLDELGLAAHASMLWNEDTAAGRVGFLKTGIVYADIITAVSRTYAREIQTEELGGGLHELLRARNDHIVGIVNGVDYGEWSPDRDPFIPHKYSADALEGKELVKRALLEGLGLSYVPGVPVLGVVSRLTGQKGFDLMFEPLPELLRARDVRFVVLGTGERRYEEFFERLQQTFPRKVVYYRGYSNELAHLIEAGADLFLMPSRFEPCGLNQMYSLRYGTVPIVRATGGLADTVEPWDPAKATGTGFVFEHYTPQGLRWAIGRALDAYRDRRAWRTLMRNGMAKDWSWERQGREYLRLYAQLAGE